jgi:hypothetical protein
LNCGIPHFSQVGKFLTVYPRSDAEAVRLARELHRATRGLTGPNVPFDRRYRRNSLVHYRYGLFAEPRGGIVLRDPQGKSRRDKRTFGSAVPAWVTDPFPQQRHIPAPGPIGRDIIVYKAHAQRGKGGVYEAVDITVSPPRQVILKEGRRHGETDWNGLDGFGLVRREARALKALRKAAVPVPELLREFTQSGKRYLVIEKVAGRALLRHDVQQPTQTSWRRAEKCLDQLAPLLAKIHAAGWVWRDCKPSHVFVRRGELRLVDFEGACRIDETDVLPWGVLHYMPPIYRGTFRARAPGTLEDDYALGVMSFQFLAGKFPSRSPGERGKVYRRSGCPPALRQRIERLLLPGC